MCYFSIPFEVVCLLSGHRSDRKLTSFSAIFRRYVPLCRPRRRVAAPPPAPVPLPTTYFSLCSFHFLIWRCRSTAQCPQIRSVVIYLDFNQRTLQFHFYLERSRYLIDEIDNVSLLGFYTQ